MNDLKHSDSFNNQDMHKDVMAMNSDMQMDLNDFKYDDFLTNYKTNDKSEVKDIISGQTYRLRFINGSSSTNFWINLGSLKGNIIAVDGVAVKSYLGNVFTISNSSKNGYRDYNP